MESDRGSHRGRRGDGQWQRRPAWFRRDSFVESISGSVLIWRLGSEKRGDAAEKTIERVERRAEQCVGVSFLVLAAYVVFDAVTALLNQERPEVSAVGIGLASVSIAVMLWLARAKRRTAADLGSRALAADAEQTQACWYLSIVALAGIGLNALFGWWWADPVAAFGVAVLLVGEGWEAWGGEDHDNDALRRQSRTRTPAGPWRSAAACN